MMGAVAAPLSVSVVENDVGLPLYILLLKSAWCLVFHLWLVLPTYGSFSLSQLGEPMELL